MTPSLSTDPLTLLQRIHDLEYEIAAYRLFVIPRADYDRALERAESAEAHADALTARIAQLEDRALSRQVDELRGALAAVLRTLDRTAGSPEERAVWDRARGVCR